MAKVRDISRAQYLDALRRNDLSEYGFLSYVTMPNGLKVSALNGGDSRRAQLAYILRAKDQYPAKENPHDRD